MCCLTASAPNAKLGIAFKEQGNGAKEEARTVKKLIKVLARIKGSEYLKVRGEALHGEQRKISSALTS